MKAVGVIEKDVAWEESRKYFFWRLRRKLAEFDLRKKMMSAGNVGRGLTTMTAVEASAMIKEWYTISISNKSKCSQVHQCLTGKISGTKNTGASWNDDKRVLAWMAEKNQELEVKVADLAKKHVADEVFMAMSAGGNTSLIGTAGIVDGISRAMSNMTVDQREALKNSLKAALQL